MHALFFVLRRVAATLVVVAVGCALLAWVAARTATDLPPAGMPTLAAVVAGPARLLSSLCGGGATHAATHTRPTPPAAQPTSSAYEVAQISDAAFAASDLLAGSHVAPVAEGTSIPVVVADNYLVLCEDVTQATNLQAGDLVLAEGVVHGVGAIVAGEAGELVLLADGHELQIARSAVTRRVFGFIAARPGAPRFVPLLYPTKQK